jgi:hypothetical protein
MFVRTLKRLFQGSIETPNPNEGGYNEKD